MLDDSSLSFWVLCSSGTTFSLDPADFYDIIEFSIVCETRSLQEVYKPGSIKSYWLSNLKEFTILPKPSNKQLSALPSP